MNVSTDTQVSSETRHFCYSLSRRDMDGEGGPVQETAWGAVCYGAAATVHSQQALCAMQMWK